MLRTILLWVPMALALALHAQSPTIRGYEYWFNQDHASRVFVPVAPATTVDLNNVPLNTAALTIGTHIVHLRLKDQDPNGVIRWSTVVTRTFEKYHSGPWAIVAVRYWVGNPTNEFDPLIRTKIFDSPQQVINYANSPLDLCGYPTGNQTLQLQLKDNHGQWSSVVSRSVTVNPAGTLGLPAIAASPAQSSYCPGTVVTFTVTPPSGPNIALPGAYTWTVPSGSGWSHVPSTGNTISVTIGNAGGTVQVFSTNYCGTSATASFPVSIPAVPAQPSVITPTSVCAGSSTTFSVTAATGTTYQWVVNGGAPITGGATYSTTLSGNASVTVTPVNSCGVPGPPRTAQITVSQPSNAGTNGNLTTCSNSAAQSLFAQLGGSPNIGGTWNPNAPAGNYDPATLNPGVYTYTVSGVAPCPNATATVTVVENQAPDAGGNGTLSTCSNGASASLFAQLTGSPQGGGTWSGPSTTTGSYNPATMNPGVYTYTVNGMAPCGNASATVTVSETNASNAGTNSMLALCQSSGPTDLFAVLGGSPQTGGTWSGPSPTLGMFDPASMQPGDYTYEVAGSAPCPNASAIVSVAVNALPIAGSDGTLSLCSNSASASLFQQLGGTPQTGGSWTGPSTVVAGMYDPAAMNPGVYTYTVNGLAPCGNASATVTVSETTAANAGINGTLGLCENSSPASLFNALGGNPETSGTWSPNAPNGMYDPGNMVPGTYTYTVSGAPPCLDATASVTVTESTLPVIIFVQAPDTVLVNSTATFSIQEIPGASYQWPLPTDWSGSSTSHEWSATVGGDAYVTTQVCVAVTLPPCAAVESCTTVVVNGTVGIADVVTGKSLTVFPNPGRDLFTVAFDGHGDELSFEVIDLTGRSVVDLGWQYARFTMDLSHLTSGTYLLRWNSENGTGQTPVMVQR